MTTQIQSLKSHSSCLYLLRKLRSFDVSQELLQIMHKSLVDGVSTFKIVAWYGNLSEREEGKIGT